jgi:hypothetical protein
MVDPRIKTSANSSGKGLEIPGAANIRPAPLRWAVITPSYEKDFELCKILCRSIDVCIPDDVLHVLIVDRRDRDCFSSLQSHRRKIIFVEDILPWWIRRLPLARRWWLNLCGTPIRNWVLQQIVKIQAAASSNADAVLFVDSDVAFVRPFSPHQLEREGKIALNRVSFTNPQHTCWLRNARSILGVAGSSDEINYIGNLISWRVSTARALVDHLGKIRHRHWIREFASRWQVSEYMVYGTFVEHVLGMEASGHFPAAMPLIHLSWGHDLTTEMGVDAFFNALEPRHVAIMIHSKNGIAPARYRSYLEQFWARI